MGVLLLVFLLGAQFPAYSLNSSTTSPRPKNELTVIAAQSGILFDNIETHHWIAEPDWADDVAIDWGNYHGRDALQVQVQTIVSNYAIIRTDGFTPENWEGWQGLKADIYQEGGTNGVDIKIEFRGPDFDGDRIENIYCENTVIQSAWKTCTWAFETITPTLDYSQVSHLSVVFDHLSNQTPTFYVDNIRLYNGSTEQIWDTMDKDSRNWFYFGNWYNWLEITPTFGLDEISHNGYDDSSNTSAGAIYLEWDYSGGVDPRHPKAEIGTKDLDGFHDWQTYNRVIADVKVTDADVPLSIFFWDEDTKSGHNTDPIFASIANEWQTVTWNIYWPPTSVFTNTNIDELKFVVGDIYLHPTGNIFIDNIRIFSLDCEVRSTADNGLNSLRYCLENAEPNDYIGFDPTIFSPSTPNTITLSSELPTIITDGLTIDGTGTNVVFDGQQLSGTEDGISISNANNVTIQSIQIKNFPGNGVHLRNDAQNNIIGPYNTIANNNSNGVLIEGSTSYSNTITLNQIFDNSAKGISLGNGGNAYVAPPTIITASTRSIVGEGTNNSNIEIYSDSGTQGRVFEGTATVNKLGKWSFHKTTDFVNTNLIATETYSDGNTSEFSAPVSASNLPAWTIMIYLNGDNDLDRYTFEAFNKLELAAYNPNINIVSLWDRRGATTEALDDTRLYLVQPDSDIYRTATYTENVNLWRLNGLDEWDMGSPEALVNFISEARNRYPANHYLLSIVDHGGGWSAKLPPDQAHRRWALGGSGLSWDESSNFNFLSTYDMKKVFEQATSDGGKIDIVFYDACLMGMFEEAYQIRNYVDYFIASENESWASFPYDAYLENINQTTTSKDLAIHIVDQYHESLVSYPRTMAAIDLSTTDELASGINDLSTSLIYSLTTTTDLTATKDVLYQTFSETQKFDSDYDLILSEKDAYLDLYNFADNLTKNMPNTDIATSAQAVMDIFNNPINPPVIRERHGSGVMWMNEEYIDLDDSRGISIYVPFWIEESCSYSNNIKCVDFHVQYYLDNQLDLAKDTTWNNFIFKYLEIDPQYPFPPSEEEGNPIRPLRENKVFLPIILK